VLYAIIRTLYNLLYGVLIFFFMWGAIFCLMPVMSRVNGWILLSVRPVTCPHFNIPQGTGGVGITSSSQVSSVLSDKPLLIGLLQDFACMLLSGNKTGTCSVMSSPASSVSTELSSVTSELLLSVSLSSSLS
jgi:hypothetical protein